MQPPAGFSVSRLDSPIVLAIAAVGLVVVTTFLYAAEVFAVSGGVVWVPFHAAVVGLAAAAVGGYLRLGLAAGFALACAPFLGFRLDWALFGLSSRPLVDRLAYFVRPDGLAWLGAEAIVVGAVGYVGGRVVRRVVVAAGRRNPAV